MDVTDRDRAAISGFITGSLLMLFLCAVVAPLVSGGAEHHPVDGEWVSVGHNGVYYHVCCDCGLTHVAEVKRDFNGYYVAYTRNAEKTEWQRHQLKQNGKNLEDVITIKQ